MIWLPSLHVSCSNEGRGFIPCSMIIVRASHRAISMMWER